VADAERAFRTAARKIGLRREVGSPRPTLHALRHTFAVRALESCPDNRDHITKHIVALSTYLGHGHVAHTYWYLEATPQLMRDVSERCERFITGGRPCRPLHPIWRPSCERGYRLKEVRASTPVTPTPMRSACCCNTRVSA